MVVFWQFTVSDGLIVATMELIGVLHVRFYPGDHNMPRHYVWNIGYELAITWRRDGAKFSGEGPFEQLNEPLLWKGRVSA